MNFIERFSEDEAKNEVYDKMLNIYWRKEAETPEKNDKKLLELSWENAIAYAWQQANDDKNNDKHLWRLPTVEELSSLINIDKAGKIEYPEWMPEDDRKDGFWTSSPDVGNDRYAWFVYFNYGVVYYSNRINGYAVRLVRRAIAHKPVKNH